MWPYDNQRQFAPLKFGITTPPAVEPVGYNDVANFLRLPTADDAPLVNALITAGRMYVEQRTRTTLITTGYTLYLDWFPTEIYLPARPLQAVQSISYTDQSGNVDTLDVSRYLADPNGPRPTIIPPLGTFFPIAKVQTPNAVQVTFTAGFGPTAASVPEPYKLLIMQWVATNYNQREAVVIGRTPAIVPHTFEALFRLLSLPEV